MNQPTIELDRIVEAVLAQLGAAARSIGSSIPTPTTSAPTPAPGELQLRDRVITIATLEGQLAGVQTLRVRPRAVVTPAVVDLLRTKKIQLVRDASSSSSAVTAVSGNATTNAPSVPKLAPILVCGNAAWFGSLARHLCPKQATVEGSEEAISIGLIEKHFERGGRGALWISPAPFAASVALQGKVSKRAVQLPSMLELSAAISQAKPEIIVVDSSRWTVAGVGNLVRTWLRSN